MSLKGDIENYLIDWNNKYPIDFWWRKKYNIPFGSKLHKEANFIDMYADFVEEQMMCKFLKSDKDKKEEDEVDFIKNNSKVIKMNQDEIDSEFDSINLDDFNVKK